ncbi:MAG: Omp28-related outer membrane protein [Saprospiraceae bacterium]|nr:Omp28-related outer membrane protein [Saprospiraceae bacterium]
MKNCQAMHRIAFVAFLFFFASSIFAQKRVIIEKFTSSNCGSCPNGALIIKELQEEYPGLIWVSHHKPTTWMDYDLDNDQSDVLFNTFNNIGTPVAMVDRTAPGSNVVTTSGAWEGLIVQAMNQPAYVNIEIENGFYNPYNRAIEFTVSATFEDLPPGNGPFHIGVMMVQDSITGDGPDYDQSNYFNDTPGHPLQGLGQPIVGYVHNNIARAVLDGPWGSADVIPNEPELNQTYSKTYQYTLPDFVDFEQTRAVVLVARHDENDITQRQVFNANERAFVEFVVTNTEEPQVQALSFRLSPNPVQKVLNIQLEQLPEVGRILNAQGQVLETLQPTALNIEHEVSNLPKGAYIAQFFVDGKWWSKRFIVQ